MKLLSSLKASSKFKNALYWIVLIFTFLYVFCVPSFGEETGFLRYTIYFSMIVLTISSLLYCYIYKSLKLTKYTLFIPAFVIFAFFGTAIFSKEFRGWFSLVLLAVSFFAFLYAFISINDKYRVVQIIALGFFVFSLYFIVYYRNEILSFRSYGSEAFRLGTHFDNQNGVGAYAVVGFASALYVLLFWKKAYRYLFIVPAFTSLIVGITTGSRTFILALAVFILVFLYFKFKKYKIIYLIVVAATLLIGILLLNLPFMATMKDRIVRSLGTIFGFGTRVDTSTIERVIWSDFGFTLGSKNILLGYGVSGFSSASGVATYAHSNYAEVLCDFGVIGLFLFYAPLVILFIKSLLSKRIDKNFLIPFFVYYIIVSFSNVIYYKKIYFLILAFLFFLVYFEGMTLTKKNIVPKLKSVAITCDTMGSGGAERVISILCNEFSNKGIHVSIIGVADNGCSKPFYDLDEAIKYIPLCKGSKKRIGFVKRIHELRKEIKQLRPDAVISFLPNANIYSSISLIGLKVPHIVAERNNPYVDPKGKITRLLKKLSFMGSDGAVFQTKQAREFYPAFVKEKSTIIYNPVTVLPTNIEYKSDKNHIVLSVGRLVEQKNYLCLLDAFKIFNERFNNEYKLKIYGEGPLKETILSYIKNAQIDKYVELCGNDKNWQLKEKDDALFVLSSDYEGMPNSLIEAMVLGIPVISTDCPIGGPAEIIKDGFNGYLVPVGDSNVLALKMIEVANADSKLIFDNTRLLIGDLSSEKIANQWIEFIESLKKDAYEENLAYR